MEGADISYCSLGNQPGQHGWPEVRISRLLHRAPSTLRAIFMDLGTDLGEQGFRWIFIVNSHRSPSHNRVLNQAGDYFHDVYGGHMVNLEGLLYRPQARSDTRSEEK
jgi:hypothetical protein